MYKVDGVALNSSPCVAFVHLFCFSSNMLPGFQLLVAFSPLLNRNNTVGDEKRANRSCTVITFGCLRKISFKYSYCLKILPGYSFFRSEKTFFSKGSPAACPDRVPAEALLGRSTVSPINCLVRLA